MFARFTRRLLVTCVFAAAACGGDSGTSPSSSVAGSYALVSVNGHTLPYVVVDTVDEGVPYKLEVMSPSSLTLSGSTFKVVFTTKVSFFGTSEVVADTVSGTFTQSGGNLTLLAPDDPPVMATWDFANQITINAEGDVMVFRRS